MNDQRHGEPHEPIDLAKLASGEAQPIDDDDDDDEYDPGWLGTVLRWPVRVVAVVVIMPVQVAWESVKAAGRAVAQGAHRVGRGVARVLWRLERPLQAVVRRVGWVLERTVWWPVRWFGRGAGRVAQLAGRGIAAFYDRVLVPVGHGVAAGFRAVGRAAAWAGHAAMSVLRPVGRFVAKVALAIDDGFGWLGHQLYRWVLRPVGIGLRNLFRPFVVLGRGVLFVLRLLGHWIVGLLYVIGEGLGYAWRVGAKVGRGFVWMWNRAVWYPVRYVFGGVWRGLKAAGRALRAVAQPVIERLARVRRWYRREISEPIRSALAAARRDIRRALPGRRGV